MVYGGNRDFHMFFNMKGGPVHRGEPRSVNLGTTGSDDACNEVIHYYQLKHINDCNEARSNATADVVLGYYCESPQSDANTCHVKCQETIDKLESVCNPAGGPLGK